jgi:hypothetical protein
MMKISDEKKEIEIVLDGSSQNNGVTKAVFRMTISRPVAVSAIFGADDIATEKGKTGIRFGPQSKVADAFKAKNQSVMITLPESALAWIRTESEKFLSEKKAEAEAVDVKSWTWTDDGMPCYFPDGVSIEFRKDLEEMKKKIEKYSTQIWRQMREASQIVPEKQNYRWYTISHEKLLAIVSAADDAQKSKDETYQAKRTAQETTAFAIAKETGEKAMIRKWTVPCEGREEECSTDVVIEYAMPDGTKKTEQHHTW